MTKLIALFADWESYKLWTDPDETTALLIEMLDRGSDLRDLPLLEDISRMKDLLVAALNELKRDWERREAKLEQARFEQQFASRLAILDFRVKRFEDRLAKLQAAEADERVVRMISSQLSKAQQEKEAFLINSKNHTWGAIEHEEIAVGFLEVPG
jgi:hypothetical protein